MELILQQQLPHQQKAIDAIVDVFCGAYISAPTQFYTNPTFSLADTHIATNIKRLQSELPPEYHSNVPVSDSEYLNLDIKMETGTGKTYVYTKTMFELHKRYGFNKFIIAVPSLAIKAGTEQFLNEPYARRHFTDGCGYGTEIETLVLESPKNKKKGRSYFPSVVSEFVKGSCQNTKKIYVLLVNMQLLTNGKMLTRDDYDYGVEGLGATALTYADGTVKSEISQGRIGTKIVPGTPSGKYLYDSYAYDSPLEKDNIIADIDEVIVYGKIPRASIAIPTITGGMYSPDFMYVVKHKNGHKELNIIVETKDVENKTDLRGTEKAKIECAKVFFNMLTADGYTVHFRDQLGNKQMAQIISEVMRGEN